MDERLTGWEILQRWGKDKADRIARNQRSSAPEIRDPGDADESIEVAKLSDLIVELWRVDRRSKQPPINEPVRLACERAIIRVSKLGFRYSSMEGERYAKGMKVFVIDHIGGENNQVISECVSPAIYFREKLVRPGEVITKGE